MNKKLTATGNINKYIFLDFDGVITTLKSKWALDKSRLDLLGKILDETDAKIVISSSWRRQTLEDTLKFITKLSHHVPFPFPFSDKVVGVTKRLYNENRFLGHVHRGEEIKLYIQENFQNENFKYVILDDDNDMLENQQPFFINTHCFDGLDEDDVEKAIKILNN